MDSYEKGLGLVLFMLKGVENITPEVIKKKVDSVSDMLDKELGSVPVDRVRLAKDIESRCEVWWGEAKILDGKNDHKAWLPYNKGEIAWKFWKRYERYLMEEKRLSQQSISRVDEFTDQALELCENPLREGPWDRRGMVVGHVQSGKTANYIGLICKAADAGYKLIIVLAGMHKSLRSQTQMRLDAAFLGFDTRLNMAFNSANRRIGVGVLPGEEFLIAHSLTNSADKGDFNRRVATQVGVTPGGNEPILLVVKKNKSVLENLIKWAISVQGQEDPDTGKKIVRNIPLLVIDDEADNASINTNPIPLDENGRPDADYDVSSTNGKIRSLLTHFEQSAYVGYTATPFANIFIYPDGETETHGEDLFPRDFIINLPPPPNYTGPSQIFGLNSGDEEKNLDGLPVIRVINDYSEFIPDKHDKYHVPDKLPASLEEAMKAFVIASAARMARGDTKCHNSMLIHVTRFTNVQGHIGQLVNDELNMIRRRLEHSDIDSTEGVYADMKKLWDSDYVETTQKVIEAIKDPLITELKWEDVKSRLYDAAARTKTKIINGTAKDILDYSEYPEGINIIAIGGEKLSRGLTLDGLSVSYYLRASRMYDTLMQMGRWFGFRPGYIDLCRLYTSEELVKWYSHINGASEELRSELDYMSILGATPLEYGLRVKTHPDGLLITAANKMRSGTKMELSYANSIAETVVFSKENKIIEANFSLIDGFISDIKSDLYTIKWGNYVWKGISPDKITSLLKNFIVDKDSKKARTDLLIEFIEKQNNNQELTDWTVAFISNTRSKDKRNFGGLDVGLTLRTDKYEKKSSKYCILKGRIISPSDEYLDLSQKEIDNAWDLMKNDPDRIKKEKNLPQALSGPYIRQSRPKERGLLLIYALKPSDDVIKTPFMGLALSFPGSKNPVRVTYKVNNTYWEQEFAS